MRQILCLTVLGLLPWAHTASASILAESDAYIQGGSLNNTNFGNATTLLIKRDNSTATTNHRITYFRFALSDAPAVITDATLSLNFVDTNLGTHTTTGKEWTFHLYGLNDLDAGESWAEGGITWSNAPANTTSGYAVNTSRTTDLGTFTVTERGVGQLDYSATALTQFLNNDTNNSVTFILLRSTASDTNNSYVHGIAARNHSTTPGPQLLLVPEPTTAALLSPLALALLRRRGAR